MKSAQTSLGPPSDQRVEADFLGYLPSSMPFLHAIIDGTGGCVINERPILLKIRGKDDS